MKTIYYITLEPYVIRDNNGNLYTLMCTGARHYWYIWATGEIEFVDYD